MMRLSQIIQKIFLRLRGGGNLGSGLRKFWWRIQGAKIGSGTNMPRVEMVWPHQTVIGNGCVLETGIHFKFDGVWQPGPSIIIGDRVFIGRDAEFNIRKGIQIGNDALIASGCRFIDHDHATTICELPMNRQPCPEAAIILENDVWLGVNVVVLKGVHIGSGAVVGAGAVVTKSVPPYEIWAGVPARKIGRRAAEDVPHVDLIRDRPDVLPHPGLVPLPGGAEDAVLAAARSPGDGA